MTSSAAVEDQNAAVHTPKLPRGRARRGRLENLPNMPLDVLFEVMRHLMPMDLLHLARTSRAFHGLLMTRSATGLWRAARKNVDGLPDCPTHLSEPAYAKLAFDSHCHSCLKPGIRTVFWALGVRYCRTCQESHLHRCKGVFNISICNRDIMPTAPQDGPISEHWHRNHDYRTLPIQYSGMTDEEKAAHRGKIKIIAEHAAQCQVWQEDWTIARESELKESRQRRLEAIVLKLRTLGWGDELDRMAPDYRELRKCSAVSQPRHLTERIWHNIKQNILLSMEEIKRQRLDRERFVLMQVRCNAFNDMFRSWFRDQPDKSDAFPRAGDFMRRPEIHTLLGRQDDALVDFEPFRPKFSDWTAEWREGCSEKLRDTVRNSQAFKNHAFPTNTDPLSLASVLLTCKSCNFSSTQPPPMYPALLTHDCLYEHVHNWPLEADPLDRAIMASITIFPYLSYRSWSCERLEIGTWHERASIIIRAYGKDPMTTTKTEMDKANIRLWCDDCTDPCKHKRQVFRWRGALMHYAMHDIFNRLNEPMAGHPPDVDPPIKWETLSGDLVTKIKLAEIRLKELLEDSYLHQEDKTRYHCLRCDTRDLAIEDMLDHLIVGHGVGEDEVENSYYRTSDADILAVRPILLLKPEGLDTLTQAEHKLLKEGAVVVCDS